MRKLWDHQKHLITIFNVISCVLLLVFALVILQQTKKNENYDAHVMHTYEVLRIAGRIINNVSEIESSYRGYFLTGSEAFLSSVQQQEESIEGDMVRLESMIPNSESQKEQIHLSHGLFARYKALQEAQREIYRLGGASGLVIADIQQSKNLMNAVKLSLDRFTAVEMNNLTHRIAFRKKEQFYHITTIVVGAAVSILGLIVANMAILMLMSASARTTRRLQDVEEIYRVILESTNDGVYDYDAITDKMIFSDTYRKQLGYSADELSDQLQENFRQLVHPDDYERVVKTANQYMTRKILKYSIDYRIKHKDGHWVWMLDRAIGTWNKEGGLVRMIGIHTDITKQKKQEETLRELNVELESFTYVASHDLRAPLVNLKGFAREIESSMDVVRDKMHLKDVASNDPQLIQAVDADIPEALGFINSSIEKMDRLTNAILNLSRIGRRIYKPVWLDMNNLIQQCLKNLTYEINERQIQVTVDELPDVFADELAVEQIFSNILENAIKYLVPERRGEVSITSVPSLTEVVYVIRDNGRGIQEKDKEKIFDIFQRARNVGNVRGDGMGLSFVKAAVRKAGGRIWFESEENVHTTFFITMPRRKKNKPSERHDD